jgi:hypothetical protein
MMEAWANGHVIESLQAGRELDMAEGDLTGFGRWGPLQRSRKAMKFVLTTMFGAALLVAFLYGAFCLMY